MATGFLPDYSPLYFVYLYFSHRLLRFRVKSENFGFLKPENLCLVNFNILLSEFKILKPAKLESKINK